MPDCQSSMEKHKLSLYMWCMFFLLLDFRPYSPSSASSDIETGLVSYLPENKSIGWAYLALNGKPSIRKALVHQKARPDIAIQTSQVIGQ